MNEHYEAILTILEKYQSLTKDMEKLLKSPENEVDFGQLQSMLEDRVILITKYDELYSKVDQNSPEYPKFIEEKNSLIKAIKLIDDCTLKEANKLLEQNKDTLKQINSNKQAISAYYGSSQNYDGIFIDKIK